MNFLKASIFTTVVLILALFGYIFFTFDSEYELNLALEAFQKGDYAKSEEEVQKLARAFPKDQLRLYQAYLARGQHQLKKSDLLLEEALVSAQAGTNQTFLLEIYLNQALNAYLKGNQTQFSETLKKAHNLAPNDNWVNFLLSLNDFCRGKYSEAKELWEKTYPKTALSGWMKKSFEGTFTPLWISIKLARCQLEEHNYTEARLLQKKMEEASINDQNEINLTLGLTYLKEAQDYPIEASLPYYKLAFSYFNLVPIQQEKFALDKQKVTNQVYNAITKAIEVHQYEDIAFYLAFLESWESKQEMQQVASFLIQTMNHEMQADRWAAVQKIISILNHLLPNDPLRQQVNFQLNQFIVNAIDQGKIENLTHFWEIVRIFQSESSLFHIELSQKINSKILASISLDDQSLSKTVPLMTFWKLVENDPERRFSLAQQLMSISEAMWNKDGEEQKALNLMRMAAGTPKESDKKKLQVPIETIVRRAYGQSLQQYQFGKIQLLMQAMREFNMSEEEFQEKQSKANYLADAKYLQEQRRYDDAKKIISWILIKDPEDQEARAMIGSIDYHLANYSEAKEHLQQLKAPNSELLEKLYVSRYIVNATLNDERLLKQIEETYPFKRDTYLRLGFGLLASDHYKEAMEWLPRVTKPDNEVYAAMCFANYKLNRPVEAINHFKQLQQPCSTLEHLQGTYILSQIAVGNGQASEEIFNEWILSKEQPKDEGFSYPFQHFKKKKLDELDKSYIAGLFYKKVKQDNQSALQYFEKIQNPSPKVQLLKGEILAALGHYKKAEKELTQLIVQTNVETDLKQQAAPILGEVYTNLGQNIKALDIYQDYFNTNHPAIRYRMIYAQVLTKLRLFESALEQLKKVKEERELTTEEAILFISTLIHTNHFDEAGKMAEDLLNSKPPLKEVEQLQLAKLFIILGSQTKVESILKRLPSAEKMNNDAVIELIDVLIQMGGYNDAIRVAQLKLSELRKTSKGLFVLAKLQSNLSLDDEALVLAKQALKLDPHNDEIYNFILKNEQNLDFFIDQIKHTNEELGKDPQAIEPQINYIKLVISEHIAAMRNQKKLNFMVFELDKALSMSNALVFKYGKIPELHLLQGQVNYFLEKNHEAIDPLKKATTLDISYSDAYKYQAIVLQDMKQTFRAIQAVKEALKYQSSDAEGWQLLYELYAFEGTTFEAINAIQTAIKFHPNEIKNYILLGKLYLNIELPEESKKYLALSIKLNPNNPEALKWLFIALNDKNFQLSNTKKHQTIAEQIAIYIKLQSISPKTAREVFSR